MNCHESQDLLQCRLDGARTESPGLDEHLAICPDCRELHRAGGRLLEGVVGLSRPLPPPGLAQRIVSRVLADRRARQQQRRLWLTVALAASVLIMALAGYTWLPILKNAPAPAVAKGPNDLKVVPDRSPSLSESMEGARDAVASLTERLTEETKKQAQRVLSANPFDLSPTLPLLANVDSPLDSATASLRHTGQGVSEGLQPLARSARRAVSFLFREIALEERN